MTVRLRHIGCESVIVVYHGEVPLESSPRLRSKDWARPDGSGFDRGSAPRLKCPDCGKVVGIVAACLEPTPRKPAPRRVLEVLEGERARSFGALCRAVVECASDENAAFRSIARAQLTLGPTVGGASFVRGVVAEDLRRKFRKDAP